MGLICWNGAMCTLDCIKPCRPLDERRILPGEDSGSSRTRFSGGKLADWNAWVIEQANRDR